MDYEIEPVPRPQFSAFPRSGCHNVEGRVLLRGPHVCVTQLRFGPHAFIDEHSAPIDIDVICLEGRGLTAIDGVVKELRVDHLVRWPAHKLHRLFTEDSSMLTLMVEHVAQLR